MTSLIAWLGIDSRGPASIYIASESRISFEGSGGGQWDAGRKTFASLRHPDIFGYCGDALFASQVLGQIVDAVDARALFGPDATPEAKFEAVATTLERAQAGYPPTYLGSGFSVIHCSRRHEGMASTFVAYELSWTPARGWDRAAVPLPQQSGLIRAYGSGKASVTASSDHWENTEARRTSRSVFAAFCDSLRSGADPGSGGAPQLVGLYRKGPAESFGVVYQGRRYLHGLAIEHSPHLGGVEWRNELFERCDGRTGERLPRAQPHPRPQRL